MRQRRGQVRFLIVTVVMRSGSSGGIEGRGDSLRLIEELLEVVGLRVQRLLYADDLRAQCAYNVRNLG